MCFTLDFPWTLHHSFFITWHCQCPVSESNLINVLSVWKTYPYKCIRWLLWPDLTHCNTTLLLFRHNRVCLDFLAVASFVSCRAAIHPWSGLLETWLVVTIQFNKFVVYHSLYQLLQGRWIFLSLLSAARDCDSSKGICSSCTYLRSKYLLMLSCMLLWMYLHSTLSLYTLYAFLCLLTIRLLSIFHSYSAVRFIMWHVVP